MVPEYEFPTLENPWNIYLPLHFSHTEVHRINDKNDPIRKKFRDIDSPLWHYFDRINPSTGSSIICGRVGDFDDPDHAYVYDDIKYFETRGIRLDEDDLERWGEVQRGLMEKLEKALEGIFCRLGIM